MFKYVYLLVACLCTANALILPIQPKQPRCMIVYTVGEAESIKLDLRLPQLDGQMAD